MLGALSQALCLDADARAHLFRLIGTVPGDRFTHTEDTVNRTLRQLMSGQGSSVSLVGAYVLAGELAAHADHVDAFAAYERRMRPFAERNQALATGGSQVVTPATREELDARNAVLRDPGTAARARATANAEERHAAHSGLVQPDYAVAV